MTTQARSRAFIVVGHLAGVILFRTYFSQHLNLTCGSSALYVLLAEKVGAVPDRPSGWPLLLRMLLKVSEEPTFLVIFNSVAMLAGNLLLPIFYEAMSARA